MINNLGSYSFGHREENVRTVIEIEMFEFAGLTKILVCGVG